MAKVAVLVPSQELCNLAQPLVGTFPSITLMTLEYIKTSQAESRARELERQGCDLIVARGVQARIIKQSVKLPVVEISVTLQELASVMLELKSELALPCPRIGLIGVANMFSDTSRFNELFGIELKLYMVRQNEELANAVSQAQADGCVGVIGGDIVCETARQKKLAYKYIPTGSESVHNALNFASRVGYAIDLEKHNSAEINALLNYTFNGIIQVDSSGVIRRVNRIGYSLLGQASSTLLGCSIYDALPNLNRTMLEDALLRGKEAYSFLLDINHKGVVVNIAPILVDSQIEGAVLTFQEGQRLIDMDSEMRRELYQRGFVARYNFDNIICDDPETPGPVRAGQADQQILSPHPADRRDRKRQEPSGPVHPQREPAAEKRLCHHRLQRLAAGNAGQHALRQLHRAEGLLGGQLRRDGPGRHPVPEPRRDAAP